MSGSRAPYSLLRRLTLAFSAGAILVFALMGAFLYQSLSAELRRRDDIEISNKLSQFLQLARESGSTHALRTDPLLFHDVLLSHPGVYLTILDPLGAVLFQHSDAPASNLNSVAAASHVPKAPYTCEPSSIGPSRCVFADETLPSGETIRVLLVRSAADRQSLIRSFRLDIWLAAAIGAALVGALGFAVARRGLSPVKYIGHQASRIEAHNLSDRLDILGAPVELRDIVVSVNRMLDRLERAFVRLTQFSSDLAHDMRTPLANVISASQVTLSRPRTTDEYEALIDSNIEECERLQRMIENMLFLARTDNARLPAKVDELEAGIEMRRLASYFHGLAEETGIRIEIEGHATIHADATMFRRAVCNLISNALQHAHAGSRIALSASESESESESESGRYAAIEVTNQGERIPPDQIEKIFERFYRVDTSRHGSARNMGLGLAIVKSIMELHRGAVAVVSDGGRTTFTLYFPRSAP